MASGYQDNKDNRALEEARTKRVQEEEKRRKSQRLQTDIDSKKHFLTSTTSTINAKTVALHQKERELKSLESDQKITEQHEKTKSISDSTLQNDLRTLEQKERTLKNELQSVEQKEREIERKIHSGTSFSSHSSDQKKREVEAAEREVAELKRQIDQLSRDKTKLESEIRSMEAEFKRSN